MRKPLVVAALALSLTVLAPPAPGQADPKADQVNGTGTAGLVGAPKLHVNAKIHKDGVKGKISIEYPDGTAADGNVTCLAVVGGTADLTAVITRSKGPRQAALNWSPGKFLAVGVLDRGEPGTEGPDLLNFSPGLSTAPNCADPQNHEADPIIPIVAGNYKAFDAG